MNWNELQKIHKQYMDATLSYPEYIRRLNTAQVTTESVINILDIALCFASMRRQASYIWLKLFKGKRTFSMFHHELIYDENFEVAKDSYDHVETFTFDMRKGAVALQVLIENKTGKLPYHGFWHNGNNWTFKIFDNEYYYLEDQTR